MVCQGSRVDVRVKLALGRGAAVDWRELIVLEPQQVETIFWQTVDAGAARQGPGGSGLAVDVSNWLRPGAVTSPERMFCYVYGRDKGQAQRIPGLAYFSPPRIAARRQRPV